MIGMIEKQLAMYLCIQVTYLCYQYVCYVIQGLHNILKGTKGGVNV